MDEYNEILTIDTTCVFQPMLEHVRIHPELVTGTKDHELDPSRWVSTQPCHCNTCIQNDTYAAFSYFLSHVSGGRGLRSMTLSSSVPKSLWTQRRRPVKRATPPCLSISVPIYSNVLLIALPVRTPTSTVAMVTASYFSICWFRRCSLRS